MDAFGYCGFAVCALIGQGCGWYWFFERCGCMEHEREQIQTQPPPTPTNPFVTGASKDDHLQPAYR
jgi:hypothetical protein